MNRETLIYHILEFSTNVQTNRVWLGRDYFDLLLSPYKDQIDTYADWYLLNGLIYVGYTNQFKHTIEGYNYTGLIEIDCVIVTIDPVTSEKVKPKEIHKNLMFTS
jgi:hypothetical protein